MDLSGDIGSGLCWGLTLLDMTEGSGEKVCLEKSWDVTFVIRREPPWARLLFIG